MMQAALEREVVSITLKPHCSQVVAVDALAQSCLGCIKSGGTLMSWICVLCPCTHSKYWERWVIFPLA